MWTFIEKYMIYFHPAFRLQFVQGRKCNGYCKIFKTSNLVCVPELSAKMYITKTPDKRIVCVMYLVKKFYSKHKLQPKSL